jgi:hypothetical protein
MSLLDSLLSRIKCIKNVMLAGNLLPNRPSINFVSGASVVDNPANNSTDITIAATANGFTSVGLANGLNSNVDTSGDQTVSVTGPTAAFSVDGFVALAAGARFVFVNPRPHPCTIVHNGSGSSAKNKTITIPGVNIALPPNGGTAAFVYNGSNWVLEHIGVRMPFEYNVRDFGTTGNGTTDDTTAIQDAFTACAVTGGVVYLPAGTYKCSSPLALGANTNLKGANIRSTILSFSNAGDGITSLYTLDGSSIAGNLIEDLWITCTNSSNTGYGVHQRSGTYFTVRRCTISGFYIEVLFDQTKLGYIQECNFAGQFACVWLKDPVNVIEISDCNFACGPVGSGGCGIIDEGGTQHQIFGNNFDGVNPPATLNGHSYTTYAPGNVYVSGAVVTAGFGGYYYTNTGGAGTATLGNSAFPTTFGATVMDGSVTWTCTGLVGSCGIYCGGLSTGHIHDNYFELDTAHCPCIIFGQYSYASLVSTTNSSGSYISIGANSNVSVASNFFKGQCALLALPGSGPKLFLANNEFDGSSPTYTSAYIVGGGYIVTLVMPSVFSDGLVPIVDAGFVPGMSQGVVPCMSQYGNRFGFGVSLPACTVDVYGNVAMRAQTLIGLNSESPNNDVSVESTTVEITSGPSAAFTITGFDVSRGKPSDGTLLDVYNFLPYTMSFTNLDAGSSSGKRIIVGLTTSTVGVPAPSAGQFALARFRYSGSAASGAGAWLLLSHS